MATQYVHLERFCVHTIPVFTTKNNKEQFVEVTTQKKNTAQFLHYPQINPYIFNHACWLSTYVPSRPRTASSASLGSSNSTKAKPGGFLATHTFLNGPYLLNADSISCFDALLPKLPTYTLHERSHSR